MEIPSSLMRAAGGLKSFQAFRSQGPLGDVKHELVADDVNRKDGFVESPLYADHGAERAQEVALANAQFTVGLMDKMVEQTRGVDNKATIDRDARPGKFEQIVQTGPNSTEFVTADLTPGHEVYDLHEESNTKMAVDAYSVQTDEGRLVGYKDGLATIELFIPPNGGPIAMF